MADQENSDTLEKIPKELIPPPIIPRSYVTSTFTETNEEIHNSEEEKEFPPPNNNQTIPRGNYIPVLTNFIEETVKELRNRVKELEKIVREKDEEMNTMQEEEEEMNTLQEEEKDMNNLETKLFNIQKSILKEEDLNALKNSKDEDLEDEVEKLGKRYLKAMEENEHASAFVFVYQRSEQLLEGVFRRKYAARSKKRKLVRKIKKKNSEINN